VTVAPLAIVCAVLVTLAAGLVVGWLIRGGVGPAFCRACGRPLGHLCVGCWRTRPELREPDQAGSPYAAAWNEWH